MANYGAAHDDQSMLDLGPEFDRTDNPDRELSDPREARRSIQAMVSLALSRGYATSIGDLLDQVAELRQYKPYNGLLAILQRPHATYLLPEPEWTRRWRRPVGSEEHPLVLLVPSGPVMFLFDVSQTEETAKSRPLPPELANPYAMEGIVDADVAVAQLTANAKHDGFEYTGPGTGGDPQAASRERVTVSLRACPSTRAREPGARFRCGMTCCSTMPTTPPRSWPLWRTS